MIQIFQESIPFSNQRVEGKISEDGTFSNPIIMPFALNTTVGSNVFETVFYIRNTSVQSFYKDVTIMLMTEDSNLSANDDSIGVLKFDTITSKSYFSLNSVVDAEASLAYPYTEEQSSVKAIDGKYKSNYLPVVDHPTLSVKFSYGYDEVSLLTWSELKQILIIPSIGNSTMPDMSYIPIRMRIELKDNNIIVTERSFFLDVSYSSEGIIEGV